MGKGEVGHTKAGPRGTRGWEARVVWELRKNQGGRECLIGSFEAVQRGNVSTMIMRLSQLGSGSEPAGGERSGSLPWFEAGSCFAARADIEAVEVARQRLAKNPKLDLEALVRHGRTDSSRGIEFHHAMAR